MYPSQSAKCSKLDSYSRRSSSYCTARWPTTRHGDAEKLHGKRELTEPSALESAHLTREFDSDTPFLAGCEFRDA